MELPEGLTGGRRSLFHSRLFQEWRRGRGATLWAAVTPTIIVICVGGSGQETDCGQGRGRRPSSVLRTGVLKGGLGLGGRGRGVLPPLPSAHNPSYLGAW